MEQDLRKRFEHDRAARTYEMKEGHEVRFLARLETEIPIKKKNGTIIGLRVAASVIALLGISAYFLVQEPEQQPLQKTVVATEDGINEEKTISLGDLSPDLKKIENYYVAHINYELSQLNVSHDHEDMVNAFMERLGELDTEYGSLNKELNELGPNDGTISALIQNLQLRLQLLQKLKEKLNQLKSSKNEQQTHSI